MSLYFQCEHQTKATISEQGNFSLVPFPQGSYVRLEDLGEVLTSHRFISPNDQVREYEV